MRRDLQTKITQQQEKIAQAKLALHLADEDSYMDCAEKVEVEELVLAMLQNHPEVFGWDFPSLRDFTVKAKAFCKITKAQPLRYKHVCRIAYLMCEVI